MRSKVDRCLAAVCLVVGGHAAAQGFPAYDLSGTPRVTINNSLGDQYDPHVDGDLAAYSSIPAFDEEIRYYRFSTGIDLPISNLLPNGGTSRDLLSDVQGGRIVFNRIYPGNRTAVMLFDVATQTATEINPTAGSRRLGVTIGGTSVVYIDLGLAGTGSTGEVVHWDSVNRVATRLTTDTVTDQNPAVSPLGDVIVWERCATSILDCDIQMAFRVAGAWTVSPVASAAGSEASPDTNGTVVAYEAMRAGSTTGSDIYWRPVAGGPEQALLLAGEQYHPTISGNFIAFESRSTLTSPSDIYAYDLVGQRFFRLTNTPLFNETLNDVTAPSSASLRAVWQSNDEDGVLSNVYGADFGLGFMPHTDRSVFLQSAGSVRTIDFDTSPCGGAIVPPPTGLPIGTTYSSVGVDFTAGAIFADTANARSLPNVASGRLRMEFSTPTFSGGLNVVAVLEGGTHSQPIAILRAYDANNVLLGRVTRGGTGFIGFVSGVPVSFVELEPGPDAFGVAYDDLTASSITTPVCVPPVTQPAIQPPLNTRGWTSTSPVSVQLVATAAAGVREIHYSLSGAQAGTAVVAGDRATVAVSAEGLTTVEFFAVSSAGVQEVPQRVTVGIDVTAPRLFVPGPIVVDAVGPAGARVSLAVTATDNLDPSVAPQCSAASGTVFPIGVTRVTCSATDHADLATTRSFTVTVRGAADQLLALIARVQGLHLPHGIERSLIAKLLAAHRALDRGRNSSAAVGPLLAFVSEVRAQSRRLGQAEADSLIAGAHRIVAVIGASPRRGDRWPHP